MFEQLDVNDSVPATVDHDRLAKWARLKCIPPLHVAMVLSEVIDTDSNIGMDAVRHLIEVVGSDKRRRLQEALNRNRAIDDFGRRYVADLVAHLKFGSLSDSALKAIAKECWASPECEPLQHDFEIGKAGQCRCGGSFWWVAPTCDTCGAYCGDE